MASYLIGMQTRRRKDLALEKAAAARDLRINGDDDDDDDDDEAVEAEDDGEVAENNDEMDVDAGEEFDNTNKRNPRPKHIVKSRRVDSDDESDAENEVSPPRTSYHTSFDLE